MNNTIKGLIIKDLYVFKNYKRNIYTSFFVFILVIFLASFQMDVLDMGSIIFLIFFGMNSISSFSYDENAESDKYLLSLPISKKEIVQAKYLFTFLNSFLSLVGGFIISLIITLLVRHNTDIAFSLRICIIAFTSTTLLMATDIPCIYKWGVEKGRMQAVLIPLLLVFIISFIGFAILLIFPNLYNLITLKMLFQYSPIICLIANILIYFISYQVSLKIFSKKEL